ncbi:MAG: DegT/DnrJ/EryC1/StrS family aminotransferase [Candidatus Binatia bacterium]|jgi:perosamine synthetase
MNLRFPVFEPDVGEEEALAVAAAVRRGEISGTFGESIAKFERAFASYCGAAHGVAVTSGTAALHLAAAALDLGPGDEVLVSASTNIATALAIYHVGATPVPIDSEPTTWNLDLDQVEASIGPNTKAIFVVHLFGHPVDMDRVGMIARTYGLRVVEDAAEAHGATVRNRKVGSFGDLACFSFYANKHITTGEGGMVLTNDEALAARLRLLRNLAFSQPRFRHELAGFNYRMTGYQAAMGLVQMQKLEPVIAAKRRIAGLYNERLGSIRGLQLPTEMPWARHVYWMYGVVVRPEFGPSRDELAALLGERGIDSRTFFCPMNIQPCFQHIDACSTRACPVAENLWHSGLYLPSSTTLAEADITHIADEIRRAARGA